MIGLDEEAIQGGVFPEYDTKKIKEVFLAIEQEIQNEDVILKANNLEGIKCMVRLRELRIRRNGLRAILDERENL